MFISYKSIEVKGDEINFIPHIVNLNFAKDIYIKAISGKNSIEFFGSQLVINMGKDTCYIYGYSDKLLNEIYKDIINHINNEFKGVYELPDIHENSLYIISIYTSEFCTTYGFDLIGNIDSIEYIKERFSIFEGWEVEDSEHPHEYAIYYNNIYEGTYERISHIWGHKSHLEDALKCFYQSIDDKDSCFKFG